MTEKNSFFHEKSNTCDIFRKKKYSYIDNNQDSMAIAIEIRLSVKKKVHSSVTLSECWGVL